MYQSREPVNYFIDRHHFTMGIGGPDFKYIPCLQLEILEGEGIYVYSILTIASFLSLLACTECVKKNKKDKIKLNFPILTEPPNCRHLHIADTSVQTRRYPLFKGFTLTGKIYLDRIIKLKCSKTCIFVGFFITAKILDIKNFCFKKCKVSKL